MAGVFTDNQPDFSFLHPGETKTWSQFWYPIRNIGPAQEATTKAALSLRVEKGTAVIGICVTEKFPKATVQLSASSRVIGSWTGDLTPTEALTRTVKLPKKTKPTSLKLVLLMQDGREVLAYQPSASKQAALPEAATEPLAPRDISSTDELYLTGAHLEQYRHATRSPVPYWNEALRRDPGEERCNNALGLWHLKRGEFTRAEELFRRAIARLTERNPNPYHGEAYYNLGLTLRYLGRNDEAYAAFYKATWNQAWQSAGFHALAEVDCCRHNWTAALDHLDRSLRLNADHLRARDLRAIILRNLGRKEEANQQLRATLELDPLDSWARHLLGNDISCDTQTRLDLALDFARAGLFSEAICLLEKADPQSSPGTAPLSAYYLGWLRGQAGDTKAALDWFKKAAKRAPDYCFPARLEEIAILETAIGFNPRDARAPYYLGNLLYDKKRHVEAIRF